MSSVLPPQAAFSGRSPAQWVCPENEETPRPAKRPRQRRGLVPKRVLLNCQNRIKKISYPASRRPRGCSELPQPNKKDFDKLILILSRIVEVRSVSHRIPKDAQLSGACCFAFTVTPGPARRRCGWRCRCGRAWLRRRWCRDAHNARRTPAPARYCCARRWPAPRHRF